MRDENKRVVLVTGASSGIGRAVAGYLAGHGFRVYGTSRSETEADGFVMLPMDVTEDASVEQAVAAILTREGRLDIVVNNAGMGIAGPLETTSAAEASAQFEVNFFGVLRVCRAVLPVMRRQRAGYLVNISSIGGLIALPYQSLYSASKFALEGMSEALRMEVRPFGVRVVLIEPGDHKTGFTQSRRIAVGDDYRAACNRALGKAAQDEQSGPGPEQIARLIHRVVNQKHPRLRYSTGPLLQRAALWLKRLGPYSLTEFAMRTYYGTRRS